MCAIAYLENGRKYTIVPMWNDSRASVPNRSRVDRRSCSGLFDVFTEGRWELQCCHGHSDGLAGAFSGFHSLAPKRCRAAQACPVANVVRARPRHSPRRPRSPEVPAVKGLGVFDFRAAQRGTELGRLQPLWYFYLRRARHQIRIPMCSATLQRGWLVLHRLKHRAALISPMPPLL